MENKRVIQVDEKVPVNLLIPLSIQHLLAMFGASVLVPFVFGINPAVVLFMNGVGTLLYIAYCTSSGNELDIPPTYISVVCLPSGSINT